MAPHAEENTPATEDKPVNGTQSQSQGQTKGQKAAKGKKKGDVQSKERIQRFDQLYSKKKRNVYFVPTPRTTVDHEKPGHTSHVVLKVRRIICDKGYPSGTEIDIKSTLLKDALSDIFDGVEGLQLNESPPVISPELLFHARHELSARIKAEEAKPSPNKARIEELGVAVQYIAEDYASDTETLASLSQHDEITFNLLWTLFPPNTTVYTKSNLLHEPQILRLTNGDYAKRENGSRFFQLNLRFISHDGAKLGWVDTAISIDQFEGAKKVHNLLCFPLTHHPSESTVRKELLERGRIYAQSVQHHSYHEYNGASVTENRDMIVEGEYKKSIVHISGRIMLDPCIFSQQNEYTDLLKPSVETELPASSFTENDFLHCNHCVAGFSFRQKKWCLFAISRLAPVIWNADAFSKLVMEPRKRDLIHSLVKSHKNGAETFDDVVSGKGKGLVGLLSGNPGVGKTLTAEVISEVTKRPLYMLSAGELGTHSGEVESRLDMVLEVTRQWGCVLLIDEADVFLQERDGLDLERNALVSVFLRRLEYFQGVLIMTTNRKNTIDAAFDSRIHFKLHYADLSVDSRVMIWKNCLANVPAGLLRADISDEDLRQLATLKLNGRQIKNAMSCAVSIAVEEKQVLTIEGIRVILDMVVEAESD